jgi:tetratricopeptide (TPR) repeat protein
MNAQSDGELLQAYEFLKNGNTIRAKTLVEDALANDLDNAEVIFALRCVNFWAGKLAEPEGATSEERGDFLLRSWKRFVSFIFDDSGQFERCMNAMRIGIFSAALDNFIEALGGHKNPREGELYYKAGICHKKLGEYETALSFLSYASTILPSVPAILVETADCYALCGNERAAKVLFRDAFFLGASSVDTSFLDCLMIVRLIKQVEQKGFTGDGLLEWIPVYGVVYGVFNVKRELRPPEASKLKQAIFTLESELKGGTEDTALLVPRLINHYFWLIDHFAAIQGERNSIEETLLKIKLLDVNIYKQYAGKQNFA